MGKKMQVLVVFEFDGVDDLESDKANKVVQVLTEDCERLTDEYGADCVWVEEVFMNTQKWTLAEEV